jgi:signal transduction protein with GAF and PtsI domain
MSQENTSEYFRLFFETAQTLLSSPSLQPTLDSLVRRTSAALGVKAGSLRLIDEKTGRLELAASHGLSRAYLEKGSLDADRSVPEVLVGKAVAIPDAYDDPRIQYREELRKEGLNTLLSVPVIARDRVIGVLRLYAAERREFSPGEIELLSALAELGGLAIANARICETEGVRLSSLLGEVGVEISPQAESADPPRLCFLFQPVSAERSLEFFRTLHELVRAILSTLDSREVMQLIVDKVRALMGVKGCALRLINETTHELELLASRGLSDRFLRKGPPHTDRSIRETLEGFPILIADTATDPRLEYPAETLAEGIASLLSLPIVAHERVIGVLRIYSAQKREYSREEVNFLSALAEIAGIAVLNARLYERTRNDLSFWTATMGYLQEKPE